MLRVSGAGLTARAVVARPRGRGVGRWALVFAGWALLSLLFAPELYLYTLLRGESVPWLDFVLLVVVNTAVAAIFAPAILWLTRRFPLDRESLPRSLPVHAAACLVFALGHSAAYYLTCYASHAAAETLLLRFQPNLVTYWAIVALAHALDYLDRYRDRERQLAQARVDLLKAQLRPHFLFNALNTISAMVHADPRAADRMVSRLSELLRAALASFEEEQIPLRRELELLALYVEIERDRFGERLSVCVDAAPEALDARVPPLLLQPLVENAVRHGFGLDGKPLTVRVAAARAGERLRLEVTDDGGGVKPRPAAGGERTGLGLANTRQRLLNLYGTAQALALESPPGGGTRVRLELPFAAGTAAR
jgi:signal transduction histidine kinase